MKKKITFESWTYIIIMFLLTIMVGAILASIMSGCSPSKKLQKLERKFPELFVNSKKDSTGKTVIHYIYHDSIITVPGATNTIKIPSPCPPSLKFSHTGTFKHGSATVTIQHDTFYVTCQDSAYKATIHLQGEVIDSQTFIIDKWKATTTIKAPKSTAEIIYTFFFWLVTGGLGLVGIVKYIVPIFKPKL